MSRTKTVFDSELGQLVDIEVPTKKEASWSAREQAKIHDERLKGIINDYISTIVNAFDYLSNESQISCKFPYMKISKIEIIVRVIGWKSKNGRIWMQFSDEQGVLCKQFEVR